MITYIMRSDFYFLFLLMYSIFTVIADEDATSLLSEEDLNGSVKKLD